MNKEDIKVIIIDDDKDLRVNTADLLSTEFNSVEEYSSPKKIIHQVHLNYPAVILTDLRMPDDDGLEFFQKVKKIDPQLPVVLMTAYGDISIAVDAMKEGIFDFLEKPFTAEKLMETIHRSVEKRFISLSKSQSFESQDNSSIDNLIIGYSQLMRKLKNNIINLAGLDIPVMIHGETGSGKELVAKCLHEYSHRKEQPFIAVNCAAIPEQLAEAELFGHSKGAFTDAKQSRVGKLEHAKNGTLFLDEVESLPMSIQAKLLRALSDNAITPIGSNKEIPINCRVISATKEDLKNNRSFRQDLFFRLEVASLYIPPLSQRNDDIVHLFEIFTMQKCEQLNTEYRALTVQDRNKILNYQWPGNVRELINVTTRHALKHCKDINYALESEDLLHSLDDGRIALKERIESYEASIIESKLAEYNGKVSEVLKDLSIERRTFNQKLNKYGINSADFKKRP